MLQVRKKVSINAPGSYVSSYKQEKISDAHQLAIEEFGKITADDWKKRCDHVLRIEEEYRSSDLRFDHITKDINMKFSVGIDSSSDESDSSDESVSSVFEM